MRTWRLIVPILLTLGLGLLLTVLFAALAVGTLNLVSVGFGVMFVGIAVDFAIQFAVRFREYRHATGDPVQGMRDTAARAGIQILCAALATAAGFLAFVPTAFSGVAELGLIAGGGMLIAFLCTLTFLPAAISVFSPRDAAAEVGFVWAAPAGRLDRGQSPLAAGGFHRAGRPRARGRAADDLRLQPAAHQKPEHRGDAHVARPDRQPADQSVHDRHRGAGHRGGGRSRR